ncbi:DUF2642 domain-containing protein [Paenibacillus sp. GCM10012307]|uniref:DUF2642 domain-containing protein n=1 Tax=Paenibacillus roseus TaxID=2798579 RepID=A0A934J1F7_9BACL|nr:DUF2642 domain-containing protein [Paenibacillus roseus]MBJ6363046.1 DUF2642 domain-containing protein [Paenibacillus roseus]
MADIVLLRCDNNYARNAARVTLSSSSSAAPSILLGTSMAAALEQLTNAGFSIQSGSADGAGFSFTLIRGEQPENPGIIDYFKDKIGENVTIETLAGTVGGTVLNVGIDVIKLQEPAGDILLVRAAQINAAYP